MKMAHPNKSGGYEGLESAALDGQILTETVMGVMISALYIYLENVRVL